MVLGSRSQMAGAWLLTLGCACGIARAQEPSVASTTAAREPAARDKAGKELHAWFITGTPPRIDGTLDDDVWTHAPIVDDLVQHDPDNMAPPRASTIVQVAYTDRMVYVAVRASTGDVAPLTTGLGRRDAQPAGDLVRVMFDPKHDHLNAYVFEANPSGVQSDFLYVDDTRQSSDYDSVWEVRTTVSADSWTAEFAIPFSQMRFAVVPGVPSLWGFNVGRDIYRTGEFDRWVSTPRGEAGVVSRFGHVVFDHTLTPPRRVELMPFTLARGETQTFGPSRIFAAAGVDLRVGLGTAATLSATVNPDFGQVEQDPSVLNLSIFETFFPEKRPFFLEDSRLFVPNFPQMLLFHSRRIGRAPAHFPLAAGDTEIERPDTTTILGAAKITGKSGGWSYGGLSALTAAEYATVNNPSSGPGRSASSDPVDRLVEPRTSYNVGRVLREFRSGQSNLGAMVTSVSREDDLGATSGGIDFGVRWDGNRGSWTGIAAGTDAPVDGRLQTGGSVLTNVSYARKHWGIDGRYDTISPTFHNVDLGFLGSRVDKSNVNYGLNAMQPDPIGPFKDLHVYTYGDRSWNARGFRETNAGAGLDFSLRNYWAASVRIHHAFDNLDDLDSRGGPPILKPSWWLADIFVRTDSRKSFQGRWSMDLRRDRVGGWTLNASPTLRARPLSKLQMTIGAEYQSGLDLAQWIANVDVTGDDVIDNIYGRLLRHVISITGRATYAFSRDMTLEAYMQPFVAVGQYTDIRRLSVPRSFTFAPGTLSYDPDFNDKSVRGNVVFRWEYTKGSALFLVWNLSRTDASRPGVFSPRRDLARAFTGPGANALIVKFSYWLGL